MRRRLALPFLLAVVSSTGCGDDDGSPVDGPDARIDSRPPSDARADARPVDARLPDGGPWSHTIVVDGVDEAEWLPGGTELETTTADFFVRVTWDAANVYLALRGDLTLDPAGSWFVVCVDADPGAATGADVGEPVGVLQPSFPNGFGAEHCLRRRLDGAMQDLRRFDTSWGPGAGGFTGAQSASLLELSIARSTLGLGESIGLVALVFDTTMPDRRAYAGIYPGTFTDGPTTPVPIAYYFGGSLISEDPPNDPRFRRP